jgi:hypothetical protein
MHPVEAFTAKIHQLLEIAFDLEHRCLPSSSERRSEVDSDPRLQAIANHQASK